MSDSTTKRTPKQIAEECRALAKEYSQQYGENIFAARIASLCAELAERVEELEDDYLAR